MKKTIMVIALTLSSNLAFTQLLTKNDYEGMGIWFQNGFENTVLTQGVAAECSPFSPVNPNYNHTLISGDEPTSPYRSDWDTEIIKDPDLGNFTGFGIGHNGFGCPIVGGKATQRNAQIVTDPENSINSVLYTWVNEAYMDRGSFYTARVQPSWTNNNIENWNLDGTGFEELRYSVKFYLPDTFQDILDDSSYELEGGDITFAQFNNDATWSNANDHYQINLVIQERNNSGINPTLNFTVYVIDRMTGAHSATYIDSLHEIPIGDWNTVEFYFKEGDVGQGKFQIKLNGSLVHDLTIATHYPGALTPDGLTHLDPIDLYVHERVVNFFNPSNTILDERIEIYWDDLTIYDDFKLKKKYIKVVSPASGTIITNNNLTLSANWIPATIPNVGLPYDWKYIFWITNVNDPTNIIYTPGQKSRTLDLTPYKVNGTLRNGATYRVYTAIRNHPFIDQFGAWPDYHMEFTTDFGTTNKTLLDLNEMKDSDLEMVLSPNPSRGLLEIKFKVEDSESITKITVFNSNGQLEVKLLEGLLVKGSHVKQFNLEAFSLNEKIYFVVLENGTARQVMSLLKK